VHSYSERKTAIAMDANLFDFFDEIATGPEGRPLWAARAPYQPHDRYDLMLVPRVREWREDEAAKAALERIESEPVVAQLDREGNQVWVRLADDWIERTGEALAAGEAADHSDLAAGRAYHLTYHWSFTHDGFRAFEGEKRGLEGRTASQFVPEASQWYRFRVRIESPAGETLLRARFWREGAAEPTAWAIDARDRQQPLDHGTIGVVSLSDGVAFDDLRVQALSLASGISGDRDSDAVCDGRDNCPARSNTDQADRDGDGSGDACDACTAAFERQDLCLDEGLDPRNDLSDHVLQLVGQARHLPADGSCGPSGHYRLGGEDGLVIELPPLPGGSRYRLQFQVRTHGPGDTLAVDVLGRTFTVPLPGKATGNAWAWTGPITVELPGGSHVATVRAISKGPLDVEVLRLEEVCAEERQP